MQLSTIQMPVQGGGVTTPPGGAAPSSLQHAGEEKSARQNAANSDGARMLANAEKILALIDQDRGTTDGGVARNFAARAQVGEAKETRAQEEEKGSRPPPKEERAEPRAAQKRKHEDSIMANTGAADAISEVYAEERSGILQHSVAGGSGLTRDKAVTALTNEEKQEVKADYERLVKKIDAGCKHPDLKWGRSHPMGLGWPTGFAAFGPTSPGRGPVSGVCMTCLVTIRPATYEELVTDAVRHRHLASHQDALRDKGMTLAEEDESKLGKFMQASTKRVDATTSGTPSQMVTTPPAGDRVLPCVREGSATKREVGAQTQRPTRAIGGIGDCVLPCVRCGSAADRGMGTRTQYPTQRVGRIDEARGRGDTRGTTANSHRLSAGDCDLPRMRSGSITGRGMSARTQRPTPAMLRDG